MLPRSQGHKKDGRQQRLNARRRRHWRSRRRRPGVSGVDVGRRRVAGLGGGKTDSTDHSLFQFHTRMPFTRRKNWVQTKPCSCCQQFEIDQKKKEERRAKRSQTAPSETIQVITVPTWPNLQTMVTRQMQSYFGYSYYGTSEE